MTTTSRPRRSTGAVVAALLLFFPLGLYWMWRDRTWSTGLRWTVTALAGIVLLIAAFSSPPKPTASNQTTASDRTATQAPSPSPSAATPTPSPEATAPPVAKTAAPPTHTAPKPVAVAKATPPAAAAPAPVAPPAKVAAAPPANLCGAPSNPFGLNYCGTGKLVYSPPSDTCSYFNCINNFANGVGYMEECVDSTVSMSGGRRGACSHHGGELRSVTG